MKAVTISNWNLRQVEIGHELRETAYTWQPIKNLNPNKNKLDAAQSKVMYSYNDTLLFVVYQKQCDDDRKA